MNRLEQRAALARTHDAAGEGESIHTRFARLVGFDPAVRRETPEPEGAPAPLSPELLRELFMTDEERDEAEAAREIERERAVRADERAKTEARVVAYVRAHVDPARDILPSPFGVHLADHFRHLADEIEAGDHNDAETAPEALRRSWPATGGSRKMEG